VDRFAGMTVFAKVVESSSFAAAARHFRISPAMVSKHVRAIEEHLGVRLLNRTSRRVTPTDVGQDYYARCLRIIADVEAADRAAGDQNTTPRGLLKVSAPFTFGISHVTPAVADYLAAYPDVSVELALNDRFVDLLEEGFDVAIRIGQLPDSSLIARRLMSTQIVLCASPGYLERYGEPHMPRDLANHNCLTYSLSKTRGEWEFSGRDREPEAVNVAGHFIANNGDALRLLALAGEGIVRVPILIVDADLVAGRLVRLLTEYEATETPVSAVYPDNRFMSAKVRAFIDLVVTHFAQALPRKANPLLIGALRATPRLRAI
jgi:DNA-binding transcriptional LysR family regulator